MYVRLAVGKLAYMKRTNFMPMLSVAINRKFNHLLNDVIMLTIRHKKGDENFLPTMRIEGATIMNCKRVLSVFALGKIYAGLFSLQIPNTSIPSD